MAVIQVRTISSVDLTTTDSNGALEVVGMVGVYTFQFRFGEERWLRSRKPARIRPAGRPRARLLNYRP